MKMIGWKQRMIIFVISLFSLTYICYISSTLNVDVFVNKTGTHLHHNLLPAPIKYFSSIFYSKSKTETNDLRYLLGERPCFEKGLQDDINFMVNENAWNNLKDYKKKPIPLDDALYLFEPAINRQYTRKVKTVVIGIGVHLGPAADGKYNTRCTGIEFISWERRDHNFGSAGGLLIHGYGKKHLEYTQKLFWDKYKNDPQLLKADIIACGFDTWHCLIFAPFNKKMILNSAYRLDGHIAPNKRDSIDLHSELLSAVSYNPDVIMAGANVYEIIYHQHYLGSFKMIPLLSTCEYVHERLHKEIKAKKCGNLNEASTGYHPNGMDISIFPKRLSPGGHKVAQEIISFSKKAQRKYNFNIMAKAVHGYYNYCDLGKHRAIIVLGYSVMSYFTCEVASLGIPMFVPTPRLYAKWEKDYHMIKERKAQLGHTSYDFMQQSNRSLNYGFNPNDDFNMEALQRWVAYADYYYYKGAILFDSYEELFQKIENADTAAMNEKQINHRIKNAIRNHLHWKSIEKYFFAGENDAKSIMPKTLEEGLKLWEMKRKRPNISRFKPNTTNVKKSVLVLDHDKYIQTFQNLPDCKIYSSYKIFFFKFSNTSDMSKKVEVENSCHVVTLNPLKSHDDVSRNIVERYSTWYDDKYFKRFLMFQHAVYEGTTTITHIWKDLENNWPTECRVNNELKGLIQSSNNWVHSVYNSDQYWYAYMPVNERIAPLWVDKVSAFLNDKPNLKCSTYVKDNQTFTENQMEYYENYMRFWYTDESSVYHKIDQLNFELSVKGYMLKINAEIYRKWLEILR